MEKCSPCFIVINLLFLSFWIVNAQAQVEFEQCLVTSSFMQGYDVISEDINLDGYPDIIGSAKSTTGEVCWWRNNGNHEFEKEVIKTGLQGARSVRAADINGDGEIDIVSAGWLASKILYFENDGSENFIEHSVDASFAGAHTIDLKDVNADGHIDILCSGWDYYGKEGEIAWWENNGLDSVVWTKHLISDRFQQSPFIYGEDMDNDNDLDVVACGEVNDEVVWWENDGSGQFISENIVDSKLNGAHTVIARDVDLDGDMDILGAAWASNKLLWYENDGSQQFTAHVLPGVSGALWLDAADLDNDGDNDLIAAGSNSSYLYWYENDGNQEFSRIPVDGGFTYGFCVVSVDMDLDTDLDLLAIGKGSNTISWFKNDLITNEIVTDFDNNEYETVTIGEQVWLKENLKSLHYADGSEITEVWAYNDEEENAETYGRLYTWDAAMNYSSAESAQGACPDGWHIPTDAEWTELGTFLGGDAIAGGKLKELGGLHWQVPNTGATNESGFTALPAGEYDDAHYQFLTEYAVIWSSTETSATKCKYRYLAFDEAELFTYNYFKDFRYSVRCIKNGTVGIFGNETKEYKLKLSPNPTSEFIHIQWLLPVNEEIKICIYDVSGRQVEITYTKQNHQVIDVSHLPNGLYVIVVQLDGEIFKDKFQKF